MTVTLSKGDLIRVVQLGLISESSPIRISTFRSRVTSVRYNPDGDDFSIYLVPAKVPAEEGIDDNP